MQINIFCLPDELSSFVGEAATQTDLSIFLAASRDEAFKPVKPGVDLGDKGIFEILVGRRSDFDRLKAKPAVSLYREDRLGFVKVRPGMSSAKQLASSVCTADKSRTSDTFAAALRKILKVRAGVGVVDVSTGKAPSLKFYCTEGAARSGKVLVEFIGQEPEFRAV